MEDRDGRVLFDEMLVVRAEEYTLNTDPLATATRQLQEKLDESIDFWLEQAPDDAIIYDSYTAVQGVEFDRLVWVPGMNVEMITDYRTKQQFVRVARSFYTEDVAVLNLLPRDRLPFARKR